MLLDHVLIRRDAALLPGSPPLELLHDLGARLADHVQIEEQGVFPLIEAAIPESELQALGERIGEASGSHSRSDGDINNNCPRSHSMKF
jgi:iron-sulfur cluster repair protein YtfE (RIC family)